MVFLQAKKGGDLSKVKLPLIVPKSFRSQHQRAQAAIRSGLCSWCKYISPNADEYGSKSSLQTKNLVGMANDA